MFYIIVTIFLFFVLMIFAGVIGLLILNIAYAQEFFRRRPKQTKVNYRHFLRKHTTRKRAHLVLFKLPLLLTAGLILLVPCLLFINGLTTTRKVRSKIVDSSRLVIRTGGNCHRNPERERILFETRDAEVMKRIAEQISLGFNTPGRHCMCCGEMTFDLYRDDDLHYSFSLHHGKKIRIKGSSFGDRELSIFSRRNLKTWLEETGISNRLVELRTGKKEIEHNSKEINDGGTVEKV